MPLTLMYITNNPEIALIAEKNGVERIWIDLETLGKAERQKNVDSVKSHHTVSDVAKISTLLNRAECMVRINPWNENSAEEIEKVIAAGADRIMLPMWQSFYEADSFLRAVNGRTRTTLLLETKGAVEAADAVLSHPLLDEIHIGLNDLHLSYGLTFMFELLTNGVVEDLCRKFAERGISYGFGGIAKIGGGTLPSAQIIMEHYRLGSTRAILSRSFCNAEEISDIKTFESLFCENMKKLRDYEDFMPYVTARDYAENKLNVDSRVKQIVSDIKEQK